MKDQLIEAKSDISRTNQLSILPQQDVAEQLYQYLLQAGKGIEHFELHYPPAADDEDRNSDNSTSEAESTDDNSQADFYQRRHKYIKNEVKKRLAQHGEEVNYSDIQYFLSHNNGRDYIFFLSPMSPNKQNSSWKRLFEENKERIFNLVFKFYLLSSILPGETIIGLEELFFIHSKSPTKKLKNGLNVWGQNLLVRYNHHNVLTIKLTRKRRLFLSKDKKDYNTVDGEDLGELIVYKDKNYYYSRDRDARRSNSIYFMDFRKDNEGEEYDKFKKTQLYHYQNLMNKLEDFLRECKIEFEVLDFQADYYLENPFIKNIESLESLEIINNTGIEFNVIERQFLQNFFKNKGILVLTFYNSGNTISVYEKIENEEDDTCWRITEVIPWSNIELNKSKNYLVFNKLLEQEVGSMAYRRDDGLWCPSTKLEGRSQIDFYSQLKNKYNYLDTGEFYSIQGMNIPAFQIIQQVKQGRKKEGEETKLSVFNYPTKIDTDTLKQDCKPFSNEQCLGVEDSLICYLSQQDDSEAWDGFCNRYKLKIAPELKKIIIELGIKSWIKQSLSNTDCALPINSQSCSEKEFWAIYVRSPRNSEAQAVAVQFIYKNDRIYLKDVMRDISEINRKFRFLRKQRNSEKLINDQQYFVDESDELYINCYISDNFTPTLIGRHNIIEELENKSLKINRKIDKENSADLLPVVSYYNLKTKPINKITNRICFDLYNKLFIQYYVPPAESLKSTIKKGFRVYHLIGKNYSGDPILTSQLIGHPIAALHSSTLTQNILKISDNSQSSLLQKIAKVLVEN